MEMTWVELVAVMYVIGYICTVCYLMSFFNDLRGREASAGIITSLLISVFWPIIWTYRLIVEIFCKDKDDEEYGSRS